MKLTVQKKLAASALKTSTKKVRLDTTMLSTIKESITKADIRALISSGAIIMKPHNQQSRSRARKKLIQKRKGRQQGLGHRRSTQNARVSDKRTWINKIRVQRAFLRLLRLKGHIDSKGFRHLYTKAHGGYFRNVRHIKLYIDDNEMRKT